MTGRVGVDQDALWAVQGALKPADRAIVNGCADLARLVDSGVVAPCAGSARTAPRAGVVPAGRTPAETTYTVALPAGMPLLNANQTRRMHWTKVRRLARDIRQAACLVARSQKIPTLDRAHVVYVIHPTPQTRKRDPGNWAESAKAAVDGCVDAGIFPDDDSKHVIGPDPRLGEPVKGGQIVLHITPVDGAS